jgi:HEXXH motif-containing protein
MAPPHTPQHSTTAARRLLWRGTEPFQRRHETSAVALIALRRTLEHERPLAGGERELLSLYARASAAEPEVFTRVWTDPVACFWVRTAHELLANVLSGAELPDAGQAYCRALGDLTPRAALTHHLSDFKRFILALDHLSGADGDLESPLRAQLPFALPGTTLSLDGEGSVEIDGLRNGALRLRHGGRERSVALVPGAGDGIRVHRCPLIEDEGCTLRLQPQLYNNLPGLDFVEPLLRSGAGYQAEHRELLREALQLIATHQPECFGQFRKVVQVIALKPLAAGGYTNISYSDLPGALVVGVVKHPYELADILIHEFHHDRLFAIQESEPFFAEAATDPGDQRYYSPWRDDPRPLHGILHGFYVFQPVWSFWKDVCKEGGTDPRLLDYARDRLLRTALQLSIALHQLERHASFNASGAALFAALSHDVIEIQRSLKDVVGDYDVPAFVCGEDGSIQPERAARSGSPLSVREALREHLRRAATKDQAKAVSGAVPLG